MGSCFSTLDHKQFDDILNNKTSVSEHPVSMNDQSQLQQASWFHYCYSRYIPDLVIDRFQLSNPRLSGSEHEFVDAAVAFVDISGFTKLSESLVKKHGDNGAEMLNKLISKYFERLIHVIRDYGGDIIKFAGDAMLVVWRNPKHRRDHAAASQRGAKANQMLGDSKETLSALVLRATACNMTLLKELNNFHPVPDVCLTLHTGIGAGKLSVIFVGGFNGRFEFFVAGNPVEQMACATDAAKSGQVVVSKNAHSFIDRECSAKQLDDQNFLIIDLEPPHLFKYPRMLIPDEMEEAMLSFIPQPVINRIDSGQPASWIAEYRSVYIMFIRLADLDYDRDPLVVHSLQKVVLIVQEVINSWQGTIARLLADDKGTRFKITFGMPTVWHEDDGERIIMSALEIDKRLAEIHMRAAIGIAHGPVYCGEAGSDLRCEYTAVGFKVNLAARLMQVAGINRILCDQSTYENAKNQFHFEAMPRVKVKGIIEPIPVFRPVCKRSLTDTTGQGAMKQAKLLGIGKRSSNSKPKRVRRLSHFSIRSSKIFGRTLEILRLQRSLELLKEDPSKSYSVFLEGEGGTGKSVLAAMLRTDALQQGIKTIVGYGVSLERNTPFFIWRTIIDMIIGTSDLHVHTHRSDRLLPFIPQEFLDVSWCLNSIMDTDYFHNPDITMTTNARALTARRILLGILLQLLTPPTVIILEDMHWVDSASWTLLLELSQRQRTVGILFFVVLRPLGLPVPPELYKLLQLPYTDHLKLELIDKDSTILLACSKLNAKLVSPGIAEIIYRKTRGHPLYIEEMCNTMLEQKMVTSNDGVCVISGNFSEKELSNIPDSLEGVIVSRIDHLPVEPQLTLKVCSVIGREISFKLLLDVHPSVPKKDALHRQLKLLAQTGFLESDDEELSLDAFFYFKNGFFQDVSYGLLLLAQRKLIHQNIAHFYEDQSAKIHANYGILAHHFLRAEIFNKALHYAELAGERALVMNANADAIDHYLTALSLLEKFFPDNNDRICTCHTQLFRAYYATSKYADGIEHLQKALLRLGFQLPSSGYRIASLKSSVKHYFQSHKGPGIPIDSSSNDFKMARLLERLVYACIQYEDYHQAAFCGTELLNIAEKYNSRTLLCLAYSQSSFIYLMNGKVSDSVAYRDQAQIILSAVDGAEEIVEIDRAQISMNLALSFGSLGEWDRCLELIDKAEAVYLAVKSRRRWREAALFRGATLALSGENFAARAVFQALLIAAQDDMDILMECSARKWLIVIQLYTTGPSDAISDILKSVSLLYTDLKISDFECQVLNIFNDLLLSGSNVDIATLNSVAEFATKVLDVDIPVETTLLSFSWHNMYIYLSFIWLFIHAHLLAADMNLEKVKPYKKFLKWASRALEEMCTFSRAFNYAEPLTKVLEGAILAISGDIKGGMAILQSFFETKTPLISALRLYFLGTFIPEKESEKPPTYILKRRASRLPPASELAANLTSASEVLANLGVQIGQGGGHPLFPALNEHKVVVRVATPKEIKYDKPFLSVVDE